MRFKTFLENKEDSLQAAIEGYKNNLRTMLREKSFIYRGAPLNIGLLTDKSGVLFKEFTSSPNRESKTFTNILLNLTKNWKGLPDRSASAFATSIPFASAMHGHAYIIVPHDSVNLFAFTPHDLNTNTERKNETAVRDIGNVIAANWMVIKSIGRIIHRDGPSQIRDFLQDLISKYETQSVFGVQPNLKIAASTQKRLHGMLDDVISNETLKSLVDGTYFGYELESDIKVLKLKLAKANIDRPSKLSDIVTPDNFEVTAHHSFYDVVKTVKRKSSNSFDEIWFEGKYLLLTLDSFNLEAITKILNDLV